MMATPEKIGHDGERKGSAFDNRRSPEKQKRL
jgi:hypothetical protein